MAPKVSIVVLNYNGKEDTLTCLKSLRRLNYPNYNIYVVDNGSQDGSQEAIKKEFPEVTLIENEENLGFSKAVNKGIKLAMEEGAKYFFVLNNDVVVDPNCVNVLVSVGEKYGKVGMLQPKMLRMDNRNVIDSTGHVFRWGFLIDRGSGEIDRGQYDLETDVIGCCAGAGMYKREMLEKVGLFDESFWMYYEDAELSWRAYKMGWRAKYVPTAIVYHKRGQTANKFLRDRFKAELTIVNMAKTVKKHGGFKEKSLFSVYLIYTGTKSWLGMILGKNNIGFRPYFKALKVLF